MLPGGEQMRRFFRPEHFFRMRIKRDNYRGPTRRMSVLRRRGDHCLVTEMDAIEYADGQKNGSAQIISIKLGQYHKVGEDGRGTRISLAEMAC